MEPLCNKTNDLCFASREDLDKPGHPPSLIRVFTVRKKKAKVLSYPFSVRRALIRVFDGHIVDFVYFAKQWPNYLNWSEHFRW